MKKIEQKIKEYNKIACDLFKEEDDYDYYKLTTNYTVKNEDINKLEMNLGIDIPVQLKNFYLKMGGIVNELNTECYCIIIQSPKELLVSTNEQFSQTHSDRELSFGLIDTIIMEWDFSRYEFQEYEGLTEEETKFINDNYKCFGLWRNDDILEGAFYLFFDNKGVFRQVYYHQDCFFETIDELKKLITNDIDQGKNLEDILLNALETTRRTMIEWNE